MDIGLGFWTTVRVGFRYEVEGQGRVSRSNFRMGSGLGFGSKFMTMVEIGFRDGGRVIVSGVGSGYWMGIEIRFRDEDRG